MDKFRIVIKNTLLCIAIFVCVPAYANDVERESLARILAELDRVAYISMQAHSAQSENMRSQFDFEKLHHDIGQIKKGISYYLAHLPMQARVIESLDDDYLEAL